jgi:ribose transport system ATP-binding protein
LTPDAIVRDMLGRDLELHHNSVPDSRQEASLLDVSDLCTGDQGPLSFSVAAGEVVGLVGLRGAGHETIGRSIFGAQHQSSGIVRLGGEEIAPDLSIADRIAKGIALLSGDRLQESAIGGMTLRENLFPNVAKSAGGLLNPIPLDREAGRVESVLDRFDVRPRSESALIDWLSGGNQQKVFVGRWLETGARLFIMEEPTAGVDIGAKGMIHRILRNIAANGAAVLVVSSDFEEAASLCDRALVIGRGTITAELFGPSLTLDGLITRSALGAESAHQVQ